MYNYWRDFIAYIKDYYRIGGTATWLDYVRIAFDNLILLALFFFVLFLISKKAKKFKIILTFALIAIIYLVSLFFKLKHLQIIVLFLTVAMVIFIGIVYGSEIKNIFNKNYVKQLSSGSKFESDEEKAIFINALVDSVLNLASKSTGAIISLEGENNLNAFIEKAVMIDAIFSEPLIETIFYEGTPCHDGAVIIRKNRIVCANAYLPSTNNYDIPQSLGTRHRAAIGISEHSDCLTIVVSEETGHIAITSHGVINLNRNKEELESAISVFLKR